MKISYSEAYKYADILEILANPYALMICDYLFEKDEYTSAEELSEIVKTTESKVKDILYDLEKKGIVDKDRVDDEDKYHPNSTTYARFAQRLLSIID